MRAARARFAPLVIVAVAFLASVAAGCKRDKCLPNCELRAQQLGCLRAYRCKEECEDLHNRTVCRPELQKFEACFLKEPKDHWFCEEDGKPAPKLDVCVPERNAVSECLQKAFTSPTPPKTL